MASYGQPATAGAHEDSERREQEQEDLMASAASLWLPRTVVKRHRRKATIIWISLVIAFLAYVFFIVWDTVDSRRDPAASFQLKREVFTFPDVAICASQYQGCLTYYASDCFETAAFSVISQEGFLEDTLEADDASLEIEEAYPYCKVLPVSKMQVNETGIQNGDITYLYAKFALFWDEDPYDDYDPSEEGAAINTQFVNLFFLDVDKGVEAIGEEVTDAKLPYDRIVPTTSGTLVTTTSHMVMHLMEFEGISVKSGKKQKPEQTFTQASTSGTLNWYYPEYDSDFAVLLFDMFIPKFEYTSIEEVDPVDAWAIIGAIGGVWQFVVVGFGLFFVFSEKQAPDKKMRNFKKSVAKPATIVSRRFSSFSSRGSTSQDIEIDASDEDLPIEWAKRQRKDGSMYYFNHMTGATRDNSPNELSIGGPGAPPPPRPQRTISRMFKPAMTPSSIDSSAGRSGANGPDAHHLPPGWAARTDSAGKTYYVNTMLKTTQWDRPLQHAPSTGGPRVQQVDAPMMHRRSTSSSVNSSAHGSVGGGAYGAAPGESRPDTLSTAPSYRTMLTLASQGAVDDARPAEPRGHSSATAAPPTFATTDGTGAGPAASQAAASRGGGGRFASAGGVAESGGGGDMSALPPGWDCRTTAGGKKYYAHAASKVTQWDPPQA
ncbi:unnamed protein product [Scytosiphon promiscuus]